MWWPGWLPGMKESRSVVAPGSPSARRIWNSLLFA
jgi:hypothetical protein